MTLVLSPYRAAFDLLDRLVLTALQRRCQTYLTMQGER